MFQNHSKVVQVFFLQSENTNRYFFVYVPRNVIYVTAACRVNDTGVAIQKQSVATDGKIQYDSANAVGKTILPAAMMTLLGCIREMVQQRQKLPLNPIDDLYRQLLADRFHVINVVKKNHNHNHITSVNRAVPQLLALRQDTDERLRRLQTDKESLALQVKTLTEQVQSQSSKISELESVVKEKNQLLSNAEDLLQRSSTTSLCNNIIDSQHIQWFFDNY
uniref:Liprin-beta-1/2 coiled-coil domain-containing protein n=1 Tax=Anopheles farauti TaxID=69004 RepID=A0A182QYN1_9DIPT